MLLPQLSPQLEIALGILLILLGISFGYKTYLADDQGHSFILVRVFTF